MTNVADKPYTLLAVVYFKYNNYYSNWWLEAVQDEHKQKLSVI